MRTAGLCLAYRKSAEAGRMSIEQAIRQADSSADEQESIGNFHVASLLRDAVRCLSGGAICSLCMRRFMRAVGPLTPHPQGAQPMSDKPATISVDRVREVLVAEDIYFREDQDYRRQIGGRIAVERIAAALGIDLTDGSEK